MKSKILIGIFIILILIQFKRIDKEAPAIDTNQNFLDLVETSTEVENILVNACYDCHSYESKYPWYTNVAPLSWWIEHHIEEGRDELNLSVWGTYSYKRKDHKLEEIIEMVEEKEMPLESYLPMHPEADLSDEDRAMLIAWVRNLRKELK